MMPAEQITDLAALVRSMSTKEQEDIITKMFREHKIIQSSPAYIALMRSEDIKQDAKNDISKLAENLESAISFADLNEIETSYKLYSGILKQYGIIMPQIPDILNEQKNGTNRYKKRISFI